MNVKKEYRFKRLKKLQAPYKNEGDDSQNERSESPQLKPMSPDSFPDRLESNNTNTPKERLREVPAQRGRAKKQSTQLSAPAKKEVKAKSASKKLSKKDDIKEIAKRFRAVRRTACYSQEEIGNVIGVSYQQVQKYEAAVDRIPAVSLFMVSKALDISIKEFFPESPANTPKDAMNNEVWTMARKLMSIRSSVIRQRLSSMITSLEGL
jgi:transcriptional regulator with XRE-family HTH domain